MTEDKEIAGKPKKSGILAFIESFNSVYLIKQHNQALQANKLVDSCWQTVAAEDIPAPGSLARIILLIPDSEAVFRQQTFSTDLVAEKNLEEAISLNIESWSPYGADCFQMSMIAKNSGQWIVSVWLWKKSAQERLLNILPEQKYTHIMPEMAWHCACLKNNEPTVLIAETTEKPGYAHIAEDGLPKQIAWPENQREVSRFWRSVGQADGQIKQITLTDQDLPTQGLPDNIEHIVLDNPKARSKWLKRAQCKGVNDWFNPVNWVKPALAVLTLAIVWAAVDAALITNKNQRLTELINQSKQSNHSVIAQQEKIDASLLHLTHFAALKQRQQQAENILAELSQRIPKDIWLETIQLDQHWLDIRGRGKDVIRLLALLETVSNTEDIVLLNDVRPDARTGDEQFQIRIILTDLLNAELKP